MKFLFTMLLTVVGGYAFAQQPSEAPGVSFRTVDIYMDSKDKPLAAYQLEFKAIGGDAKIVGIEGGENSAFSEPPFYDPKAMQQERVIIAAFSTTAADKLPIGKTRIATIHIQTTGQPKLEFQLKVQTAADAGGNKISINAEATEREKK